MWRRNIPLAMGDGLGTARERCWGGTMHGASWVVKSLFLEPHLMVFLLSSTQHKRFLTSWTKSSWMETFPWCITGRICPKVLKAEDPSSSNIEGSGGIQERAILGCALVRGYKLPHSASLLSSPLPRPAIWRPKVWGVWAFSSIFPVLKALSILVVSNLLRITARFQLFFWLYRTPRWQT